MHAAAAATAAALAPGGRQRDAAEGRKNETKNLRLGNGAKSPNHDFSRSTVQVPTCIKLSFSKFWVYYMMLWSTETALKTTEYNLVIFRLF